MNKGFYEDLDTNFEQACELCDKQICHEDLIMMLKEGNIPEKQIAALKLDTVTSEDDAKALIDNLTGCDGKIREAVALKIFQLVTENVEIKTYFVKQDPKIFADATIDINANICRLVIDTVRLFKDKESFSKVYVEHILNYTLQALDELDKFIFRDKKYVINKQLFKLYWCLEALRYFYDLADKKIIFDILKRSALQQEYTIREKVAQIAILSDEFKEIQKPLLNDSNYYVRAVLNHHSILQQVKTTFD